MAARVLYTYEDLLNTPDDGKRYEIVDGELYVSAAPIAKHQCALLSCARAVMASRASSRGMTS